MLPSTSVSPPTTTPPPDNDDPLLSETHAIVAARGAPSILEELSRPVIRSFPTCLLPHLSRAALEAQDLSLPTFHPLSSILPSPSSFSTGCASLDKLLSGGLPLGSGCIVELSGAAGAGKTQVVLQLALLAGAPTSAGPGTGAVLAFTEGRPPVHRMEQIDAALCADRGLEKGMLLKRVVVEEVRSVEQMLDWARHRLPYLFRQTGASVVVVDSVAAVYRPDFDDALARAGHLVALAAALKKAAAEVGGVCVCVNQVSQSVGFDGGLSKTVPALGAAWANCVDTRVFLKRGRGGADVRYAKVLHSNYVQSTTDEGAEYRVTEEGVVCD